MKNGLRRIAKGMFAIFIICAIIVFNSCSNEENSMTNENQVISKENFELLKANALNEYNSSDFSKVTRPTPNSVNYEQVIETLNNKQRFSTDFNYDDYKNILGEYYDKDYFEQLIDLYSYSENIIQSDLFNNSSTLEDRQKYLEEILIYVILDNPIKSMASRSSNCLEHYNICRDQAERDHGIRIISCTGGAIVLGVITGGAGAATWPICMATSGFLYDSAIASCSAHYEVCQQDQQQ